jgi:AcrR family transcriptional regulator
MSKIESPQRTSKGEQTRAAILDVALALAAHEGLEGLTIGLIAERMRMSKSGVFAHFGAREELQIATLREYHRRFEEIVFTPSLSRPRGLPRLEAMIDNWVEHVRVSEIPNGCIYVSGAVEYDDRPGPVRDALVDMVTDWQNALRRAIVQAVDEGHLRADTDNEQIVYEIYGIILGLHHDARLLRAQNVVARARTALARLIDAYRTPVAKAARNVTPRALHSSS